MSEENESEGESIVLSRMKSITFSQLDSFYDEKGTKNACGNCGSRRWRHVGDDDGPALLKLLAYNRDGAFSLAFAINCEECGNMRLTNGGTVFDSIYPEESE
ncbi:hypothetical protein K5D32_02540 [Pseudomonas cichorii]|uniref:hypothetical protein n=1 Tax=Pseudomonas cichorii TaxID=36746 RepID=UPI001C89540D|nr:hypothetical protein [Pseudomonas cichorii]MBX8528521.1 hypothetical protein [Pseudomonas cichorii]